MRYPRRRQEELGPLRFRLANVLLRLRVERLSAPETQRLVLIEVPAVAFEYSH